MHYGGCQRTPKSHPGRRTRRVSGCSGRSMCRPRSDARRPRDVPEPDPSADRAAGYPPNSPRRHLQPAAAGSIGSAATRWAHATRGLRHFGTLSVDSRDRRRLRQRDVQPHSIVRGPRHQRTALPFLQLHQAVTRHRPEGPRQVRLSPPGDLGELGDRAKSSSSVAASVYSQGRNVRSRCRLNVLPALPPARSSALSHGVGVSNPTSLSPSGACRRELTNDFRLSIPDFRTVGA